MEQEQTFDLPASDKTAENSYGKFSSVEELVKAYNALESEFTRRSQRLKDYEKTYGVEKSIDEQKSELTRKFNVAVEDIEEATRRAQSETNGKIETALIGVLNEKMLTTDQMASKEEVIDKVLSEDRNRQTVIDGYIEKIKKITVPDTLPSGGISPAKAPYKPTSVHEAGEIAKAILQRMK